MCFELLFPIVWSFVAFLFNAICCGMLCPSNKLKCRQVSIFNRYANLITLLFVITFMYFFPLLHRLVLTALCQWNDKLSGLFLIGKLAPHIAECSEHGSMVEPVDGGPMAAVLDQDSRYFHKEAQFFAIEITAYFYLLLCVLLLLLQQFGCAAPLYEEYYVAKATFLIAIYLFSFFSYPTDCSKEQIDSLPVESQHRKTETLNEQLVDTIRSLPLILSCRNTEKLDKLAKYSSVIGFVSFHLLTLFLLCNMTNHWMNDYFSDSLSIKLTQVARKGDNNFCASTIMNNRMLILNLCMIIGAIVVYCFSNHYTIQKLKQILSADASTLPILRKIIIYNTSYMACYMSVLGLLFIYSCINYTSGDLVARTYEILIIVSQSLAIGLTCLMLYVNYLTRDMAQQSQIQMGAVNHYSPVGIFYFVAMNIMYPAFVIAKLRYGSDELNTDQASNNGCANGTDKKESADAACSFTGNLSNVQVQQDQQRQTVDTEIDYCKYAMFVNKPIQYSFVLVYFVFFLAVLSFGYYEFVSNSFTKLQVFNVPLEICILAFLQAVLVSIVALYAIHIHYHLKHSNQAQLQKGQSIYNLMPGQQLPGGQPSALHDLNPLVRMILSLNRPQDLMSNLFGESRQPSSPSGIFKVISSGLQQQQQPPLFKINVAYDPDAQEQPDCRQDPAQFFTPGFTEMPDADDGLQGNTRIRVIKLGSEKRQTKSQKKSELNAKRIKEYTEARDSQFTLDSEVMKHYMS